jgi:hypothetical protein
VVFYLGHHPGGAVMLMLDLCAGLGGASAAMRERGWKVITLDNDVRFNPDILSDLRLWSYSGERPDLIWASPPCDEFAREFMPWSKTRKTPDMSLVLACKRIIDEVRPRYWVIENVKGALKWFEPILGKPAYVCNPYYLWGNFPDIRHARVYSHKEKLSSTRAAERGIIPEKLSRALALAIELSIPLEIAVGG